MRKTIVNLALLLCASASLAQSGHSTKQEFQMPTQEDMNRARSRTQEAMRQLPAESVIPRQFGGAMPRVEALPKPAVPPPDIASIAEKYKSLGRAVASQTATLPDLMVFVSLSMPKEALNRIVEQAELAGATLVFRGLQGESMLQMTKEIGAITGNRNVSAVIHPPAFQQFSVTRVPAVVLARAEAGNVMDDGCSKPDTFVKVAGDVSLDYALEYIERKSPAWSGIASAYRNKIVRGVN